MGLLDEAHAHSTITGPRCAVSKFFATLKPKERAEWQELMNAPKDQLTHPQVHAVFVNHGHPEISLDMITRHRNGRCTTCR